MDKTISQTCAAALATQLLLSSCAPQESTVETGPPMPEPIVPAGYKKIAPSAYDTSAQILAQTATIFRGVLKEVQFTYDGCAGPRTNYVFSDATTLAGTSIESEVTLKVFGGPTPWGTWTRIAELPTLALDAEYVAFLRNTDWTFSPVVANLAFRREVVGGREVLIDSTGHAVTGWGDSGPTLSATRVSDPVGLQRRSYRRAETALPPEHSSDSATDPRPEVRPATGEAPADAQARPAGSALERAPSREEIRAAEMFAKPALHAEAIEGRQSFTAEALVSSIRDAAVQGNVDIGGRVTLEPYWRCWGSVPTARVD